MRSSFVLYATVLVIASTLSLSPAPFQSNNQTTLIQPHFTANPLLAEWVGPYNGVPPLDQVKVADFKPALQTAMDLSLSEIDKITANTEAPNFSNSIEALERSGETLNRVSAIYNIWSSTMNSAEFQPIEREMAPRLAAFYDKITQNTALFKRIETVYNSTEKKNLAPEQQRLVWNYYTNFVQAGAKLSEEAKKRLTAINQKLAGLFTRFNQNLLADEGKFIELKNEADLDGLPPSVKDAAAAAAETKKLKGSWIIVNTRSSVDPFLTYSNRRDLREKVFNMFINRGDNGDAHDNNAIITEILQLRAERAKLLGYPTHAHWRLEKAMAKSPERAMELMEAVWTPAVARVHEEVANMQKLADKEKANITIAPWDYRYYASVKAW